MSFSSAVGIQRGAKTVWMKEARCVYGNAEAILGHQVITEAGEALMTPAEFYALIDSTFNSENRWTTGKETHGLRLAVRECLDCPVREECLKYAMEDAFHGVTNKEVGIMTGVLGGTTSWERRTIADPEFMPHLDRDGRLSFLRALVKAKERGWAQESVRVDLVKREMSKTVIPTRVECCGGCCDNNQDEPKEGGQGPVRRFSDGLAGSDSSGTTGRSDVPGPDAGCAQGTTCGCQRGTS